MGHTGGKPSPDKRAIARMKVLKDLGTSDRGIGRKIGCSGHTVAKYLSRQDLLRDPEVLRLVESIKMTETADLYVLGEKARNRLHKLMDSGKTKVIETTAVMDRAFQQRRLLEGQSTSAISYEESLNFKFYLEDRRKRLGQELEALRKARQSLTDKGSVVECEVLKE